MGAALLVHSRADLADSTPKALTGPEVRALYSELRGAFAGRNDEYRQARLLFNGEHWGLPDNPTPIGKKYTITANYIRKTVEKGITQMIGELPAIQAIPRDAEDPERRLAERLEALLYCSWEQNDASIVFRRVAFNQRLLRRGWIYYWWDNEKKCVRFRSVAPENVYPLYDGDDLVEVVMVSQRNTRLLKRMYPQYAEKITSTQETSEIAVDDPARSVHGIGLEQSGMTGTTHVLDWFDTHGNWTRVMGEAVHSQNLLYDTGRVPLIEFPNAIRGDEQEPYSDVEDIRDLNLYLDQLLSQAGNVIKKFANPVVVDYGSGQSPQNVRAIVQNEEGGVLPARRDAKMEYLNWTGQPPDIQNQFARVMAAIYDLSGQPQSAYGQTVTNQSGVMTNLSMTPTVQTTTDRQAIFTVGLVRLNEAILCLYEKFMSGEEISVKGSKPKRAGVRGGPRVPYEEVVRGEEIDGWYKNRIKWPSALRTDDPIYVQNIIAQLTSKPRLLNAYDALELLGYEDVEAMIDRLKAELEDPRFNPEGIKTAIDAAASLSEVPDLGAMEGLDPGMQTPTDAEMGGAAQAAGNPNRDTLASGY
jgi:hypothetical protein